LSTRASRQTNNESRIIHFQKKNARDLIESLRVGGEESGRGIGGSGSESEAGGGSNTNPNPVKLTELGDIISPLVIDFQIYDDRNLVGNVNGDTQITFINLPFLLFLNLRLIIKSVDPIITIAGQIVSGVGSVPLITTAVNDFLDITVGSDDQVTIFIGTVKKNDESGADVAPTLPLNVNAIGNSPSTIQVIWDPPSLGTLPITYDVAFSTSSAGDPATGPTTHAPGSPDLDIVTNLHTITGLISATTYFVWIRAKNAIGNSNYVGPIQTNTEGITNPGGVNFAIPGSSVLWNSITINWTQTGGLEFTLTRKVTGESDDTAKLLKDAVITSGPLVDTDNIEPVTSYDYKLESRNGFGLLLGTQIITVVTPDLPTPTFVLSNIGRTLNFLNTFPVDIGHIDVQWALDSLFTVGQSGIKNHVRSLPWTSQANISFQTNNLNQNTLFFGRARMVKNGHVGPWSTEQSVTTGTLSSPSQPPLIVTSPATGQTRIKVTYPDSPTRDEIAVLSWRLQSSVGEYFDTIYDVGTTVIANSYSRNQPPSDDLNALENKVEVIREGAWSPGDSITVRCVLVNAAGTSIASTDNVLVDL